MFGRLDFTVHDQSGKPAVAVEAKRMHQMTAARATDWRRNYMDDAPASFAECIHMLVTPVRIFIWSQGATPGAKPTFDLDAERHLGPYFQRLGIQPAEIEGRAFERLVAWWLRDLTEQSAPDTSAPSARDLQEAGLLPLLAGARIVQDDAA